MSRKELKALSKQQIKGKIGALFLISFVIYAVNAILSFIPVVGSVASLFIGAAFSLSMAIIYLNIVNNPEVKPSMGDAFLGLKNIWPAFKVYFFQGLFVLLWSLLLFIPGIIKGFAYAQAFYILAENPEIGALDALKESEKMMKGHKMELFVLSLSFIGWMILGAFTFGILYIWLIPYMNAAMANFYKNLKPVESTEAFEKQADFN